jgi:hypothetical protein
LTLREIDNELHVVVKANEPAKSIATTWSLRLGHELVYLIDSVSCIRWTLAIGGQLAESVCPAPLSRSDRVSLYGAARDDPSHVYYI